ncbi:hypothetical protein ACLGI4_27630 [Streptomyces sp. HMX112]|uniref:hypothetical protein n=1 Tax=Streptomyces sp. HMX112 TaxID=3390850 RepID=UPI003A802EDA
MRTNPARPPRRALTRTASALAVAALGAALCGTGVARAAEPPAPAVPHYDAARRTAHSDQVLVSVSRFLDAARLAKEPAADGGTAGAPRQGGRAATAPDSVRVQDPVPLYELTPGFVGGTERTTRGTALRLSYLVSRVSAPGGQRAAVLLAPGARGAAWQLAGIRDTDAEAALAERATDGGQVFAEPQIHAWYRVTRAGTVEPLNQQAVTGLGGARSLPLAAYRELVRARYADKLPGSSYDRKGLAGGFGPTAAPPAPAPGTAAARGPAPVPAGAVAAAASGPAGESPADRRGVLVAGGATAAVLAAVGGAVLVRRRNAAAGDG